jgi:hypothetical protein
LAPILCKRNNPLGQIKLPSRSAKWKSSAGPFKRRRRPQLATPPKGVRNNWRAPSSGRKPTDFASRLNENQTVDVKLARKLSKAFHELETSNGWPVKLESLNATATGGK